MKNKIKNETVESKNKNKKSGEQHSMVIKFKHLVASPKQKGQLKNMARMRSEGRDGWGNLGNKKADPDDRSCRNLAATMERTWEGWERVGARWAEKQGGE